MLANLLVHILDLLQNIIKNRIQNFFVTVCTVFHVLYAGAFTRFDTLSSRQMCRQLLFEQKVLLLNLKLTADTERTS